MRTIATVEDLEAIYGSPGDASIVKEVNWITSEYRALI